MASAIHCFKIHKNLFTPEEKKALRTESRKLAMEKKIKPQEAMVRIVKLRIADLQEEYNKIEAVIKKHMKAPEKKAPEKKAVSHTELVKRYVKETGKKVEKGELDKVKKRYPTEWAKIEKAEAHKKELWNKLPEDFRYNRGVNEYTTEELERGVAELETEFEKAVKQYRFAQDMRGVGALGQTNETQILWDKQEALRKQIRDKKAPAERAAFEKLEEETKEKREIAAVLRDRAIAEAPVFRKVNEWEIVKHEGDYYVRDPHTKEEIYRSSGYKRASEVAKESKPERPVITPTKEPWETSDLVNRPNIPASYVQAKKQADGKYKLFHLGTTSEVFEGETFRTAQEARSFFNVQQVKAQEAAKAEPLSETKDRLLKNIKSEKGSSELINDLSRLGADAMRRGYTKFKDFTAEMKNVMGKAWDKVKGLMKRVYFDAKRILKGEKGAVEIGKLKSPVYVRPGTLTDEVLNKMNRYLKSLGYETRGKKDVYELLKERIMDSETSEIGQRDWADAYERAMLGVEVRKDKLKLKKEAKVSSINVEWDRIRELGKTGDIREAGYITPQGDLIDLSGKREGGTPGMRSYDHREAGGTLGMQEYMALGNIRMDASAGTFDILVEPTPAQYKKIDELVRLHRGELVVDLGEGLGEQGDTYYSNPDRTFGNEYQKGTTLSEIKNDIEKFYAGEEVKPVARPVLFSRTADMYSALTRAAEAPKFPANIPAKSVINQLKKAPGVKQVEIEISGLLEWLEGKDRVSKTDLVDFLRMTEVRIDEVEKGETLTHKGLAWMKRGNIYKPSSEFEVGIIEYLPSNRKYVYKGPGGTRDIFDTLDEAKNKALRVAKNMGIRDTKFAEHVLPGGEPGSYRELVLRVPGKKKIIPQKVLSIEAKHIAELAGEKWETLGPNGRQGYENQARIDIEKSVEYGYRSPHWDEPNIVAHIRGDARVGADGKRRFHVAEFQSDIYSRIVELEALATVGELKGEVAKELANLKRLSPWGEMWHELVAKKALEYAVKNDFDGISWDTGKTQVDRWESALRKSVDKIEWDKSKKEFGYQVAETYDFKNQRPGWEIRDVDGFSLAFPTFETKEKAQKKLDKIKKESEKTIQGKIRINAYRENNRIFTKIISLQGETTIEGRRVTLNNLIGKELATKIRESSETSGTFEGKDLTIGGEFYKILYDQRIPGFLKKYGKKWGAKVRDSKVDVKIDYKNINLRYREGLITEHERERALEKLDLVPVSVHGMDITPGMREAIQTSGQALFAERAVPGKRLTVDAARAEIADRMGVKAVDALEKAGKVKIITANEATDITGAARSGVQGFFKDGITYLIPENIDVGHGWGVLMHELGVHHGYNKIFGKKLAKEVFNAFALKRYNDDKLGKAIAKAFNRIPESTPLYFKSEEAVAYFCEENANIDLPLHRKIIARMRLWAVKYFGVNPSVFTHDDYVALAASSMRGSVREARREPAVGGVSEEVFYSTGGKDFVFETDCVSCDDVKALEEMIDKGKDVTYDTFVKNVGTEGLQNIFPDYDWGPGMRGGLRLKDDYAVSFNKSTYQGFPCYYVVHSSIEYVYVNREAPLSKKEQKKQEERWDYKKYIDSVLAKSGVGRDIRYSEISKFSVPEMPIKDAEKKVTNSKAFKKWFGSSDIVDRKGRPLVVYHGTNVPDISFFEPPRIWFTPDASVAWFYANRAAFRDSKAFEKMLDEAEFTGEVIEVDKIPATEMIVGLEEQNIIPVYLKIENPLDLTDYGVAPDAEEFFNFLQKEGIIPKDDEFYDWDNELEVDEPSLWHMIEAWDLNECAKINGYDGIIIDDIASTGVTHEAYIAFEPTQIKSIFNVGTFRIEEPDIRYSVAEQKDLRAWADDLIKSAKDDSFTLDTQKTSPEEIKESSISILKDLNLKELGQPARSFLRGMSPKGKGMGAFVEKWGASPEWYQHPVLKKIIGHALNKSEKFHTTFNEFNAVDDPMAEHDTVAKTLEALARKGRITKAAFILGRTSADFKKLETLLDDADVYGEKHTVEGLKEKGYSKDVVQSWSVVRESYDKQLEALIKPMKDLVARIKEQAAFMGTEPVYPDFGDFIIDGKKRSLSLQEAVMEMGRYKETYSPRIRDRGAWVVTGVIEKSVAEGGTEYFRNNRKTKSFANLLRDDLEKQGYTNVKVEKESRLPEETFQAIRMAEMGTMIGHAAAKGLDRYDGKMQMAFMDEIVTASADMIKSRGARSTMIRRREGLAVKGYITNPLTRFVRYTGTNAAGIAKAEMAEKMIRDLYGVYQDGKRVGGIDAAKEGEVHSMARAYIEEQLRNAEAGDRIVGIMKALTTLKFLGFNPRSVLVNMTSLTTSVPMSLHTYVMDGKGSLLKIGKTLSIGCKDYTKVMAGKTLANLDEQVFIDSFRDAGYTDAQYTRDAMGNVQGAYGTMWSRLMGGSMYVFGKSEEWVRGGTALTAFRLAKKQGLSNTEAKKKAIFATAKAHGTYGKETLPMVAWGKGVGRLGQAFYTYLKFPHNYLQMLYDTGVRKKNIKAVIFGMAAPAVLGGITAVPMYSTVMAIANTLMSLIDDDRDAEKLVYDTINEHLGKGTEETTRGGILGLVDLDISGSLSMGPGAIPTSIFELTGAVGGMVEDIYRGVGHIVEGEPGRAAEKLLPKAIGNIFTSVREIRGATTSRGDRIWNEQGQPYVPVTSETIKRGLGFRSARRAILAQSTWVAKREERRFKETASSIYKKVKYLTGRSENVKLDQDVEDRISEYNKNALETSNIPLITPASIERQLERMKTPTTKQKARVSASERVTRFEGDIWADALGVVDKPDATQTEIKRLSDIGILKYSASPSRNINAGYGIEVKLNDEQYSRYVTDTSAIIKLGTDRLMVLPAWQGFSDKKKAFAVKWAIKKGRGIVRDRLKKTILRTRMEEIKRSK